MIKALIFDMDDTLVNSSPLHKESFRVIFEKYGANVDEIPKEMERGFFGKKIPEIIQEEVDFFKLNITPEQIIKEREGIIKKMLANIEPMPGFEELIKFLRGSKYKIALATSSKKEHVDIILEKLRIENLFDEIVTAEDVKHGKPHPEIFNLTLKKLKIKPEEGIVVEDSTNGIISAQKAGIKTIAVKNALISYTQDISIAEKVVDSLSEIKEAVESLS